MDLLEDGVGQCKEGVVGEGMWVLTRNKGGMLLQNLADLGREGELLHAVRGGEEAPLHGVKGVDAEAVKGEALELQQWLRRLQPKQRWMLLRMIEM